MEKNNTEQARELFTRYLGNPIQMHREGVLQQYKQYEVDKETEKQWAEDMIAGYLKQLSIRDWEAVDTLETLSRQYPNPEMAEKIVSFASRNLMSTDSIVRLRFSENLVGIIRSHKKVLSREQLFTACRAAAELLQSVTRQPLVVDPGHELEQLGLKDKRGLNSRAKKSMDEVEALLN
ncbi:hypothetical protein A3842_19790 [Paenibacillus sp. P3E]|uniref:hypothetical protein n=1 Tax=Paenibacillus sp. P3E TaxID=1349435 RepID=UPI00093E54D4|nr:hypothetical protein [Paenibacillus sp. P3E]OKP75534.1 hypothetical protein A3842_19790 [Paenibacillus sp. P3E]